MKILHIRRMAAVAVTAAVVVGLGAQLPASAAPLSPVPAGSVTIDNTLPRWLPRAQKVDGVTTFAAAPQTVRVYLNPKGGTAALQQKVLAMSDPRSAQYRKWLTVAQYNAAYQPTQATVDAVSTYLTAQGLTIVGVEAAHRYITVSGLAGQLNKAFGVTLGTYSHDGQTVTAPSGAVTVPAAIGAAVLTVSGLDTTVTKFSHRNVTPDVTPPASFVNARPCNINYGNLLAKFQADYKTPLPPFQGKYLSYAPCGYTGPQFRAAYEGDTALTGKGVTVAITDAYRWQKIAGDANTYATNHGDGAYVAGQLTENLPGSYTHQDVCDPSGWSGEETLDVEAVHAMAPDAKIRYYAASSCFDDDFLDALTRVVDENKAQLVSNSWGDVEGNETGDLIAAYEQVMLQGAAQGISMMWSSGDNGDELASTGVKQADYPTSDPYATSVGGTSTAISNGVLNFQSGWGTQKYSLSADGKSWTPLGFLYGAGGGFSALFNRPSYQKSLFPASAPPGRAVPDVAMDADPNTGMLIGQTQTFPNGVRYGEYRIGGTSLASPLFAGMTALAIQHGGGKGLGLLNTRLYQSRTLFADVQTNAQLGDVRADYANGNDPSGGILYSVRTFGQDSSLAVTNGWDPVTGIGVPKTSYLTGFVPAPTAGTTGGSAAGAAAGSSTAGTADHGAPVH